MDPHWNSAARVGIAAWDNRLLLIKSGGSILLPP
jgi:hypothetical protein